MTDQSPFDKLCAVLAQLKQMPENANINVLMGEKIRIARQHKDREGDDRWEILNGEGEDIDTVITKLVELRDA